MYIRPAGLADVAALLELVNAHAKRGQLLPRTAESIQSTLADWLIVATDDEAEVEPPQPILGCVSLYVYNPVLAEVRSLVVSDALQGQGWGGRLVTAVVDLARARHIPTVFALTRAVGFFIKQGFEITQKERFPQKVFKDCCVCPLQQRCDEVAVVYNVEPVAQPTWQPQQFEPIAAPTMLALPMYTAPTLSSQDQTQTKSLFFSKGNRMADIKKVVLAYSGGLDTSAIVPWLRETYNVEVICFCADIGQEEELTGLDEKARASGATKCIIRDLREEFAQEFLFPMLQSGAVYEKQYLLGTSIARPLIAKELVKVAMEEGADAVSHGATGKGNDQVRFELTVKALNPRLRVIAPWREWHIRSREDAIAYCAKHNVPVRQTLKSIYSRDRNLWHLSHEGGILEDPANEPEELMYEWTVAPEAAPDKPEIVEVQFEQGCPVAVNGEVLSGANLIYKLNEIGARNGIGRVDLVENRLVGMKSHGVYETPGGTILYAAHRELESLCLERDTLHYKEQLGLRYAELVYFGQWYHPLREALQAFVSQTQKTVSGWVRLKLYKGGVMVIGRQSPYSLYREDFATFGEEDVYNQKDAQGFITLFGLPMKVRAMMEINQKTKTHYAEPDYSRFKRD